MMRELLPHGNLKALGVDAIAYACGPGSFTGLRIAASAVQGLAYTNKLPAIAISTLACQAQTALRTGFAQPSDTVLSMLDARINEVYWALYNFDVSLASPLLGPAVCPPAAVEFTLGDAPVKGVGDGFSYLDSLPRTVLSALRGVDAELLPTARDLIPLAASQYALGQVQSAAEVSPVYVREEITWKKIAEQGKPQ